MSSTAAPSMSLTLAWDGGQRFQSAAPYGSAPLMLDGEGAAGPSPMQAVAYALAGCMAVDLVHILKKGRHDIRSLEASIDGWRADAQPPRFVRFDLRYRIGGPVPPEAIERAIQLSRDKYCSVWHSLRADIELHTSYEIV